MRSIISLGTALTVVTSFAPASASAMGHSPPAHWGTVAANRAVITPGFDESCHAAKLYRAPQPLTERNGRLVPGLRKAAQAADPWKSLTLSARHFLLEDHAFGRAYADLAVTGS